MSGSVLEAKARTIRMILAANGDADEIESALEGLVAAVRNEERRTTSEFGLPPTYRPAQ